MQRHQRMCRGRGRGYRMSGGTVPSNQHDKKPPEQAGSVYSAGSGERRDQAADTVSEVFTPEEAAALLKVPESWLRKRASARQVPCTFLGKHLRFSAADLEQIISAGHRAPASGGARPRRRTFE